MTYVDRRDAGVDIVADTATALGALGQPPWWLRDHPDGVTPAS